MDALIPVLVAGGGIAYVVAKRDDTPVPRTQQPYLAPTGGSTIKQAQSQTGTGFAVAQEPMSVAQIVAWQYANAPVFVQTGYDYNVNSVDPMLQTKLDAIEAAAKKTYEDANAVAKAAIADKLNKELKLDPPLNGHEDWKTVSSVVGGAAGAVAGTALCGPVCGKLGAMAGAILGAKLADLTSKKVDELKSFLGDKWDDVKGAASDAWDYFSEAI